MSQKKTRYALTHPQKRIWYTEKLHPGTGMWSIAGTIKIKGTIDIEKLGRAVNMFLRDNESARLRIGSDGDEPYQFFSDYREIKVDEIDFSGGSVQKLYQWDKAQTRAAMPLLDSDLFYFALLRLSDDECWLYSKFHHIITDALSMVEYTNQVMDNYQQLLCGGTGGHETRSYKRYIQEEAEYLESKRFGYDREYWMERFSELPEPTVIKQKKTNYFGTEAERKAYVIPEDLSHRIRAFCGQTRVSVFALFLSALAIYINRISGKKDIIIGAPVANRTSLRAKGAFGMFVSTVPIRIAINDDLSFAEFAQVVSGEWFSALKHQKYPYNMLMQELRKTHRDLGALYDVTLSYQIGTFRKDAQQFTYDGRWHFNGYQEPSLCIHVNDREDNGRFIVDYDHHTPFFSKKEIKYIHNHIRNIVRDMIEHPDKRLYDLDLMSEEEYERVVHRFNDTYRGYPEDETLIDLWRQNMACVRSDAVAVRCGGQSMTYAALDAHSSALALHLKKTGVGVGDVVGLLSERSMDYPVSVLAILKTGGAFLPIDAELPPERISYMVEDSGAKVLVASARLMGRCPSDDALTIVNANMPLGLPDDADMPSVCGPHDLAYVIYTSGSTGMPKGVQIEHHSIAHFVHSLTEVWDFSPGARLLCAASFSFDISVMELVLSLMNGAVFVLAQEHEVNIPRNMVSLIQEKDVNMMVVTPGRMELLLSDPQGAACLRDFREIGLGGDVLPGKLLEKIQQATNARIINFYGPTEITICCTCIDVTDAKVPNIGRPMPNVKTYILDRHRNPVPIGVPGELYVGGRGVARGYFGKPELNRERFIDSPFSPGERLYRTGDLARWYPRGEIDFLGRIDKQVKIRGYRIELGEIENRLMQVSGVTACVVADREDSSGRKFLCAYLGGDPPKKADIRAQLVRELPGYMMPSYFVVMDSLPMNQSSKVDRNRLPDPLVSEETMQDDFTPPETATEIVLADIWREVLGMVRIGRDDSFFDVGGESLSITRVMAEVRQKFHVEVRLEDVYRQPRLRDFAALIDAAEQCEYRMILPAPPAADYPVSSAQQRMWILAQTDRDTTAYNIPIAFRLTGRIDPDRMERAFEQLIAWHEVLRTSYVLRGDALRQRVHTAVPFTLHRMKCAAREIDDTLRSLIVPFSMDMPPLMRAALLHIRNDGHILFIDMHHSISDKRTTDILMSDLAALYEGRPLSGKEIEYKDYAVWQQDYLDSDSIRLQRSYWQDVLSGELPLLNLHTDNPRGAVQTFSGARIGFDIDRETTDKLRSFAAGHGTTMYMLALAVYNVLLSKYTGQEDIIVGTPVAGRSRREVQDVTGVFINTLPFRNYPRGDISFTQFLEQVVENGVGAFVHADYPFERMISDVQLSRESSRNPLFDTMLTYSQDVFSLRLGGMSAELYPLDPGFAKLDLTLELYDSGAGIRCQMEYNTDLFRESTARRIVAHLKRLFVLLTDAPDTRLSDVSVLSQDELWQVTRGFNQTDMALPDVSVQSLLEDLAESQPDKTAVISDGRRLTFAALNNRANQIAQRLREEGVGRNTIVALSIMRTFDMVAGLFGVLKAGGGYLPLDPTYPDERVQFMLGDSKTKILLSDGSADFGFCGKTLFVQDIPADGVCGNLARIDTMDDAAYVIYTSGSTGIPKGATLPRRALYNLYEGTKTTIAYDPEQTSISVTTVSFDIFVIDALLPLLFGCTVALCTEEELRQPHLAAALIESADVKFIQTTPTRMRLMMEDTRFRTAVAKHIEKIVLGGEEFPLSLLELLKKHTKARIISGYGPTETTVYCTFKDLSQTSHITIGRPIVNTRMYILDKYRHPVPIGVLGEAYISGACVASGYIDRDTLNRKKFVPDPYWPGHVMYQSGDICAFMENGEMEISGRVDHQVKIRGLRIELGEIEAAMRAVDGIDEAVVKDWGEGARKYLCAYYVFSRDIDEKKLRGILADTLPSYMIPSYFVGMEELPTTLNGKVDRKALLEPEHKPVTRGTSAAPEKMSAKQQKMSEVWSHILGVDGIGPEDNFFMLGGDSLAVIKVQAAVLQFGWTISTRDFYEAQTLEAVCRCVNAPSLIEPEHSFEDRLDVMVPEYTHLRQVPMEHVLLTGATGFLGAHILVMLAERQNIHIHCIVRGKDAHSSLKRLRDRLSFYFGARKCMEIVGKVSVHCGDVADEKFGLDEKALTVLQSADTIIHSAAITDHVGEAAMFEKANVQGTRHVTAFAEATGAALVHISTISVSGTHYIKDKRRVEKFTENHYYIGQNYSENIYVRSKFHAEKIVLDAIDRGLNARIMRVGMLTSTMDGKFQRYPEKNAFANRILALCALKCVPISMLGTKMEMTPVDICAKAIIMLADFPDPKQAIFHVLNTNTMTLAELISMLEQNGNRIEIVSDGVFFDRMTALSKRGEYTYLTSLMEDLSAYKTPPEIEVTAQRTAQLLSQFGCSWPVINAGYIKSFLQSIAEESNKGDREA